MNLHPVDHLLSKHVAIHAGFTGAFDQRVFNIGGRQIKGSTQDDPARQRSPRNTLAGIRVHELDIPAVVAHEPGLIQRELQDTTFQGRQISSVEASRFNAVGQEYSGKSFALRVNDNGGCGLTGSSNVATVTFNGRADSSGSYFGITPTADGAKNVAIVIKDHSGASIAPGTESAPYPLIENGITDMVFDAYYRSTAATVEAGIASADVQFIVAIN
ncbi:fimbrial protein [Pseudomonas avellanae]|uniref:fimbrial protein n=1 Tax=Pseudomonas avellanae TaxID=46257 RepID=UPI00028E59C5|nr:fimbrial protein [Pseudomonas avellanae]EKG31571.1 Type-1 fimbrial protein, A chain precursor [Pseudomonas avellanae BPIC 631]GGJ28497.1 hypothetical protein GCM10009085_23320 [Pseudomonas avellanae]